MSNEKIENMENLSLEELKFKAIQNIYFYFSSEENLQNTRIAPSMIVNIYGDISQLSEDFRKSVVDEYENQDEIYADVVSSLENQNCSCRGRFATFIEENKDSSLDRYKRIISKVTENQKDFLKNGIEKQQTMFEHFQTELKNNKKNEESLKNNTKLKHFDHTESVHEEESKDSDSNGRFNSNYLEGNVIEIEDSPEAYGNLIRNLRLGGEFYRGLNILQRPNNKIWVYFY
jgi:hypothetical protein